VVGQDASCSLIAVSDHGDVPGERTKNEVGSAAHQNTAPAVRVAVVYAQAATSPVGAAPLATPTTFSTRRADIYMTEEENSLAGMIATGLPLLQAGPVVCASPQGIVCPSVLTHWMKDLRGLERPTAT
jgi:hypothetical protein